MRNETFVISQAICIQASGGTDTETGVRSDDRDAQMTPGNKTPAAALHQSLRALPMSLRRKPKEAPKQRDTRPRKTRQIKS
ncbi:hypothetical protein TELCIR_01696 [Teladorsagia circumcincta]|uniref:Uncharacterized protein n=1 Tax=Teladorsagia circumcincta TaxID=45464 RepID=A0A2G9V193_TELCI|nr:hypothetical protein TELCIR_01696 [Teladorsagia circumcincta]